MNTHTEQSLACWFLNFSRAVSHAAGRPGTFILAVALIVLWAATGPLFGFSNTWQLMVNTGTTVLTFLMVFVIQGAQNREAIAVQVKLDEIIRAIKAASNTVLDIESLSEEDLESLRSRYNLLAREARSDPAGPATPA